MNSGSTTETTSSLLSNQKIQCSVHKSPLMAPILSHKNSVHTFSTYSSRIHSDIILPFTPMSSKLSIPFRSSKQNDVRISHPSHACIVLCQPYLPWFDILNNIRWIVKIMKLLIMKFSPATVTSSLLGLNILLSILFSYTLNLCYSLNMTD
jgi:hypothetical protein